MKYFVDNRTNYYMHCLQIRDFIYVIDTFRSRLRINEAITLSELIGHPSVGIGELSGLSRALDTIEVFYLCLGHSVCAPAETADSAEARFRHPYFYIWEMCD